MVLRKFIVTGCALVLCGCATYEGLYAPSCIAHSGSEIRLEDGRFVWIRFTDQVVIDEQGKTVDQFPSFPRRGEYSKQGRQIMLIDGESEETYTMFLFRVDGESYLYTAKEAETFDATGKRPVCPLQLQV